MEKIAYRDSDIYYSSTTLEIKQIVLFSFRHINKIENEFDQIKRRKHWEIIQKSYGWKPFKNDIYLINLIYSVCIYKGRENIR